MKKLLLLPLLLCLLPNAASGAPLAPKYETYRLENGLKVILTRDTANPIVAVAVQYHTGSSRETAGRTGFAHLFEHLMFQRSENMPRNYFFTRIAQLGGTFNGATSFDGTLYYEQVPRDALEKVLWMESERMGYFINTVTQKGLEREIDIVSNEKRQNYDNKAYGLLKPIFSQEFYPAGHPYSWTVIGNIPDLRNATLQDVKSFHDRYYVPNNATLVVSGDFDMELARKLIAKYFGEIKSGPPVASPTPVNVHLAEGKRVYFEDSRAPVPMLDVSYPTVDMKNKDIYAVNAFMDAFTSGKNSPLYRCLIGNKNLASFAAGYSTSRELAGAATLTVIALDNVGLDDIQKGISEAFATFEREGYSPALLEKFKRVSERNFYYTSSSVLGRAITLATNSELAGNPLQAQADLEATQALTVDDVMRAYEKYFKNKPALAVSIVPKGRRQLALAASVPARVEEEKADLQTLRSADGAIVDDASYPRTPASFDRSHEPPYLPNAPSITPPAIWSRKLKNGIVVNGITRKQVPLVQYELVMKGGMLLDPPGKMGLAYITAQMLNEGTKTRTAEQISRELGMLASTLDINASNDAITIAGFSTARTFAGSLAILQDILVNPRFDPARLEQVKSKIIADLQQDKTSSDAIARDASGKLLYGRDSRLAYPAYGTEASVRAITIEDVRKFWARYLSPRGAYFNIVGDTGPASCEEALAELTRRWTGAEVSIPSLSVADAGTTGKTYFVDNPGAQQSMIRFSKISVPYSSADYYPIEIVNYKLGEGTNGLLFDNLRLKKGYTYGAFSQLDNSLEINTFDAYASVQSSVTREALLAFRQVLADFGSSFTQEVLEETKDGIRKSRASAFERPESLLDILRMISLYRRPADYLASEEQTLREFNLKQARDVIARNMNLDDFTIVVVGDARTQFSRIDGAILIEK